MAYSRLSKLIALCLGVFVMSFLTGYLILAWTEPTAAPPGVNVPAPINTGSDSQTKIGSLVINTGGAETGLIIDDGGDSTMGKVGIGNFASPPSYKLDVKGTIRGNFVASDGTTCGGNKILKRNSAGDAWACASDQIGEYTYNYFREDADGVKSCQSICNNICSNGKLTYCALEQWYYDFSSTDASCSGRKHELQQWALMGPTLVPGPVDTTCIGATAFSWDFYEAIRKITGVCVCPL